jgi:diguanylate cyclase (GGDEF)-like protein
MTTPLRALIIEDSPNDTTLLLRELERGGYATTHERVETAGALTAALDGQTWDIIFSDYAMPHFDGLAALKLVKETGHDLPFIFVSGSIGEDTAVQAMKAGAHDYIMKGNFKRLLPSVARELREAEIRRAHDRAQKVIHHMAYYDTLTDLPNRNMFYDRVLNAIQTDGGQGTPMALLLMDLDDFKEINNTLGHHRGDLLLQQVGARLRSVFSEPEIVARLGGDEFAILLPSLCGVASIDEVAQKVVNALEAPVLIQGLPIAVEASIGIALYPEHGTNPDNLLQRADVAMYAAKKSGGAVIYDAKHDEHSPLRLAVVGALRHAMDHGQLFLHYQPKIGCTTRQVMGVEALARWQHPEYGFIPPDQFILPAEQTGLIKPLTLWVLATALRQCAAWRRAGIRLDLAVNLSARNLHDPQLPDQIAGLLKTHGVAPSALKLEITESAIMADTGRAMDTLARLKAMDIALCIDDFGIGYSSLGSLKELPVEEIKIDKSFVMDLLNNDHGAAIVRATIDLGHQLGLKVVAEGVENEDVWNRLTALGCDAAQGYYMSRPLPADALTRWLGESPWGLKTLGGVGSEAA